jgi:site-specific DNA-methyltransferase (adenine-specific)
MKIDLIHANAFDEMPLIADESFHLIFVDPPYKLSNDGFTCQSGKRVSVNKGVWDKSDGFKIDFEFHLHWINNASPNLSGRMFTASHVNLIWAKKTKQSKQLFNYKSMREMHFPKDKLKTKDKKMRSVWSIPTCQKSEKEFGKHPTQKPLDLLTRIILAASNEGDKVFDPFMGSGTAGVVAKKLKKEFCGIEIDKNYFNLAKTRITSI